MSAPTENTGAHGTGAQDAHDAAAHVPDSRSTAAQSPEQLQAEITRLQTERDSLAARLDRKQARRERGGMFRRIGVTVLIVLTAILIPVAATLTWAHQTVLNTDRYVATVAPLGSNPVITNTLATQLTNQIYTAVNPQPRIAAILPPKASVLAGPIASGFKTVLGDGVRKVVTSPHFAQLWTAANRFASAKLIAVLRNKAPAIQTQGNNVVLNLVPLLNDAIRQVSTQISGLVGKKINIPTISGNELPSAACKKISTALNRPVPATCGQIVLFPASKLKAAQQAVGRFDNLTLLMLILAPVLFLLTLILTRTRRRTLLQLTFASAFTLVVVRRLTYYMQGRLADAAKPANRPAVREILSTVLSGYFTLTAWLLAGALIIALIALVTGPYRWARTLRHWIYVAGAAIGHAVASATRTVAGRTQDDGTLRWVAEHKGWLYAGGAVLGVILLLAIDMTPVWILVTVVLIAAYELGVYWLARNAPEVPATHDDTHNHSHDGHGDPPTVGVGSRSGGAPSGDGHAGNGHATGGQD